MHYKTHMIDCQPVALRLCGCGQKPILRAMMQAFTFLFALILGTSQFAAERAPVTVFAAASLSGVLEAAAKDYDGAVTFSFGGSGVMARQVAAGAPADLLILANPDWMVWLSQQGHIGPDTQQIIATNSLVVIGPSHAAPLHPQDLIARLGNGRLAMGQRDAVPAGSYARSWLQSVALWDQVQTQLAETDNVRAALALVARGETPLGIVYATDAIAEPRVSVVYNIPSGSHAPVKYPAAALSPAGTGFLNYLTSAAAAATFAAHGFGPAAP